MTTLRKRGLKGVLAALVLMSSFTPDEVAAGERLEYRWRLMGLRGALVRIFLPGSGDGLLTTETNAAGNLETELLISSTKSRKGEFYLYGSEVDPEGRRMIRAWQEQQFRGKTRSKESEIDAAGAMDLASSILFLRREPPERPVVRKIWASGEVRPVSVRPCGRGIAVLSGRTVTTRKYELRGTGQPFWSGEMDIELADDEAATPIEIVVTRDGWKVRLRLVEAELEALGEESGID